MFESPEAANLWFDIFNGVLLTGAFLVAVGTWGTIKTAAVKERFSDERVSANELETKRAVADSDAAKEGTAKAHEAIAQANAQIAIANEGAAKANERAAELKLALEKEVAARQPRRITDAQRAKIVEILRVVKERGPISVSWKLFDEEAVQFGQDVLATLKAAGFDAKEERGPMSFGVPGQWVIIPDASWFNRATYVGAIQAAFLEATGILFDGRVKPPYLKIEADVSVIIGSKPPSP